MIKEELKQEAEEYVCKRNPLVTKEWFIDAFKKKYDKGEKVKYLKGCEIAEYEAYIACAEPREKRIAELEAQIEKMKCCGNCVHFDFTEPNYCHKGVYRANQNVCGEWCFGN